jgi:methyl-accepting chemotaxis protein
MDRITQENAEMVEESSTACGDLARMSERLLGLVSRFMLDRRPRTPLRRDAAA